MVSQEALCKPNSASHSNSPGYVIVLTEAASRAIVELLEVESGVDNGNGWLLLGTINLLSLGGQALIDCMTAASLPSTLVKCLYLLFDLPPVEDGEILAPGCQFKPNERRILLQKVFVQVCCLCSIFLSVTRKSFVCFIDKMLFICKRSLKFHFDPFLYRLKTMNNQSACIGICL